MEVHIFWPFGFNHICIFQLKYIGARITNWWEHYVRNQEGEETDWLGPILLPWFKFNPSMDK